MLIELIEVSRGSLLLNSETIINIEKFQKVILVSMLAGEDIKDGRRDRGDKVTGAAKGRRTINSAHSCS